MSVSDLDKIDAIGIDKISGDVIISILDDLDWEAEADHIYFLENKIQAYLNFLQEEKLSEVYPDANGKRVRIKIYADYPLSAFGEGLIDDLSLMVEEEGFHLIHQVNPESKQPQHQMGDQPPAAWASSERSERPA